MKLRILGGLGFCGLMLRMEDVVVHVGWSLGSELLAFCDTRCFSWRYKYAVIR